MKKLIVLSTLLSALVFAGSMEDMAQKAVTDHAKTEATKAVKSEVAKAVSGDTEAKESNATEETSMKDKAIDAASGVAADKTGVSKDMAKSAIKAAI